MYITRVEIENIKSIKHLVWEIDADKAAGWHVILGDNGAGKSSFIQAAVVGCIGVEEASLIQHYLVGWINSKDMAKTRNMPGSVAFAKATCDLVFEETFDPPGMVDTEYFVQLQQFGNEHFGLAGGGRSFPPGSGINGKLSNPAFIASYGSFRRFTSTVSEDGFLFESNPILRRHQTTFSERLALPESMTWLKQTQFQALEGNTSSKKLINDVFSFVNQDKFLPHDTTLQEISSSGIYFSDPDNNRVSVASLGDGYRSVLSMTFDLIRQIVLAFGPNIFQGLGANEIFINVPGVVLIDEIDAHLHPMWQKQIGFWLTKHFPRMQFIVTTHSALICQAAEKGSIFRLPTPGSEETGKMLTGSDRDRLLYGDILDAYSTQAFGFGVTRSQKSEEMLDKLADLNMKEVMEGLTEEEMTEQDRLRAMLPTTGSVLPAKFAA